jgi:protease-4
MSQRLNPSWFVWALLALCTIAIPVGLVGRNLDSQKENGRQASSGKETHSPFADRIEVIRLSGMIADKRESSFFSDDESALDALRYLRHAVKDSRVKAVLLRINTPGGTVPTSQEIADQVIALKGEGKPVVVSMSDVAASGGYYIACAADKIVAEPGTITGSIGVIFSSLNLKGVADKLGVQPVVIKSGQFKDIASPFRAMTQEGKTILQALILDSYDQFVNAVSKGRNMTVEAVKKIADGRIYSGRQALKIGLVDELGGYDTALVTLKQLCKERYGATVDFPVKEASSSEMFSGLLDFSRRSFRFSLGSEDPLSIEKNLLPQFLSAKYYHLPLWMMQ